MRYVRTRRDGTREVVYWSGSGEPVWVEGEPAWHFWLLAVTYLVVLPLGLLAWVLWIILGG